MWVQFLPGALSNLGVAIIAPGALGGSMMMAARTIASTRRMPLTEDYMTVNEAAAKLGLHPVTIRKLIKAEKLKYIKVGYATMVLRTSVEDYQKETDGMSKFDPRRGQ
jgi:excisionase family DNA binding protein